MKLFVSTLGVVSTPEPPPIEIKTYYVRPSGTNYGNGDGTTFHDAWSGEGNIDWSVLSHNILEAYGFPEDSITKLDPTTTIIYINQGIGIMIIESTFQVA